MRRQRAAIDGRPIVVGVRFLDAGAHRRKQLVHRNALQVFGLVFVEIELRHDCERGALGIVRRAPIDEITR